MGKIIMLINLLHFQLTVEVEAGSEDCFYIENVKKDESIDFEYQVRKMSHHLIGDISTCGQVTTSSSATGRNDITVRIIGPPPK